jgi:spermidine synthase
VLDTLPFYQACRARLSESGLLAVNLLGRERGFEASAERISQAFDGRALVFPSCDSGNTIAFASRRRAGRPPLRRTDQPRQSVPAGDRAQSVADHRPPATGTSSAQRLAQTI